MTTQRRAVYPSAATSLSLARCSVEAQLLFTRLIAAADDQGRLQGDPMLVKSQCLPLVGRAQAKTVDRWLGELAANDMILRYEAHGQPLIQLVNWWAHQGWLRHLRASRWPAPEGVEDREKGHGLTDERPPDDGQPSADRPQGDGPDVSGDVDSDLDKDSDVDVEPELAEDDPPQRLVDISLSRITTNHRDLTGKEPNVKAVQMYADLCRRFGPEKVGAAQYRAWNNDRSEYGFVKRVKEVLVKAA